MIADDTILLTGLHGDEYPARVAFDDFDDDGKPAQGFLQFESSGKWHTLRALSHAELAMYWADFKAWQAAAVADAIAQFRELA